MLCDKNIPASSPDGCSVRYYSYGAFVNPRIWSVFRRPHKIVERIEGPNDGLVSVASSQWGEYKGTLVGVNHLDLINWTNRIRWLVWELTGNKRTYEAPNQSRRPVRLIVYSFNAIAFYLDIAGKSCMIYMWYIDLTQCRHAR